MIYFKLSKFFLYLVPLAVVIVTPSTLFPFIVGKYVFFRAITSLALIFFLVGLLFQSKDSRHPRGSQPNYNKLPLNYRLITNPLVIAVSAFVFIFVLASFFGVEPKISFWSNFERGEGGLQMLFLGIFFVLLAVLFREEKDWRRVFWISLLAAILVILYGIGAHLKYIDAEMTTRIENGFEIRELTGRGGPYFQIFKNFIGSSFREPGFRFSGSLGNPAYTATYLIFVLFYSAYLWIPNARPHRQDAQRRGHGNKNKLSALVSVKSVLICVLIVLFFVFFWLAATRGAFIGLVAAVAGGTFYFAYQNKRWRKWLLAAAVLLSLVIGSLIYLRDTALVKSLPGSRLFEISFSVETWRHRTYMWQTAIDGWKERPLFGWGPENFPKIFASHFNPRYFNPKEGFGAWFDRAHSIYLDYLAETGILGLLSYLSIFAIFYWQLFRKVISRQELVNRNQKPPLVTNYQLLITNSLLFALSIAYLVQGIVLFETLPLYLNLFLFLAFVNYKFSNK